MDYSRLVALLAGLVLAPLLPGVINRVKALAAGRRGSPLLQTYHDLAKLLRKGAVYSRTTTWVFRAAPAVILASVVAALAVVPAGRAAAAVAFPGDLVFFAYTLALARFATVVAALDTGSAFEGMGASREVLFSAIAEPALFLGLATLARLTGALSLTGIFARLGNPAWLAAGPALVLVSVALLIVSLAENARIPVDDPNTHLELTMIHEVMVLDYTGPDLAYILYGASLKLWVLSALVVDVVLSCLAVSGPLQAGCFLGGMLLVAVGVGVVESAMARLALLRVPRLLVAAGALSLLGFTLVLRYAP